MTRLRRREKQPRRPARRFYAVGLVVITALLSGCAPFQDEELRALVGEAAPAGSSLDCEWGSSSFEGEPDAWVGCWDYVPGSLRRAAQAVESRLSSRGFTISRQDAPNMVQLTAVRASDALCVDLLAGSASGRNTHSDEINPSPGEVFVDIWAAKPATLARECKELPAAPEE